ncbi:MAG: protein kinase [Chloroflexi bacterium]|nr:protein kinase [Chloroflexota bacterium]
MERFRREARTSAALRHPSIVQVYDFDVTADGLYYMVMEYINGQSLEHYLEARGGSLPVPEAAYLFAQVASAAHFAHQHQMIHRDIKPANILINQAGHLFLADFGIAQLLGDSRLTNTGLATGTPDYMAPEQVLNQPVTPATDIYALGGLLYKMITGRRPYEGENGPTLMMRRLNEAPEPPHRLVPGLDSGVERVILKALEKDPAHRYQDAAAMASDLTTTVEALLLGRPLTQPTPIPTALSSAPEMTTPFAATLPLIPTSPTPSQMALTEVNPTPPSTPAMPTAPGGARPLPTWVWPLVAMAAVTLIALALILRQPAATATTPTATSPLSTEVTALPTDPVAPNPTASVAAATLPPVPPDIPGMVYIPGNTFVMGNNSGNADEAPPHLVELSPYYLDLTEVTNGAYAEFAAATGHAAPTHWLKAEPSQWQLEASAPFALGDPDNRFDYAGISVQPGAGSLSLNLDADSDTGELVATFSGTIVTGGETESGGGVEGEVPTFSGDFRIEQISFQGDNAPFKEGGIADFVVMHGNSGNETPRYPEMTAFLATWGTANVYLNDELLFTDLGIHVMFNEGVRDHSEHYLPRADGSCCFAPANPEDKQINSDAPEISVWLFGNTGGDYDAGGSIWLNVYYTNITITQAPEPGGVASYPEGQADWQVTNVVGRTRPRTVSGAVAVCPRKRNGNMGHAAAKACSIPGATNPTPSSPTSTTTSPVLLPSAISRPPFHPWAWPIWLATPGNGSPTGTPLIIMPNPRRLTPSGQTSAFCAWYGVAASASSTSPAWTKPVPPTAAPWNPTPPWTMWVSAVPSVLP